MNKRTLHFITPIAVLLFCCNAAIADGTDTVARPSDVRSQLLPSYADLLTAQQVLVNSGAHLKGSKNLGSFLPSGVFPGTEAQLDTALTSLLASAQPSKMQLVNQSYCDGNGHTEHSPFIERRFLAYTIGTVRNMLHVAVRAYWSQNNECWMKTADAYNNWE